MPLPFSRRALQTAPSFSRDFAGLKTLDHGVGPAITFTRGSNATYFDASGTLRFAPNNHIRNSQALGATAGVIGSGGALPTNWGTSLTTNGISSEVIGTGTDGGIAYIDIKVSGTPTTGSAGSFRFDNSNQVAALNGQTWTQSVYVKLVGGATTNAAITLGVAGYDSSNAFIAGQINEPSITTNSNALSSQRKTTSFAFTSASVAFVFPFLRITYTNGNPIDLTLRIAAPQLEIGSTATDYNPTTGTAYFGPRFDHSGGSSLGLLIEEARQNTIIQSADLSTTWTTAGITVTTNQATAPDGTTSADLLQTTLINEAHSIANSQTYVAGAYTFSVFAKYQDHQWITLRMGFGGDAKFATFDIQNAVTGTATAGVTRSITSVGGGWYRLVMTATLATAGTQGVLIILNDADDLNNTAYTGTGTGAYLWGAQLEAGAFPTSYIPTTSAAVTRAADVAVVDPINSFYNATEGTLFTEAVFRGTSDGTILCFDNNSTAERWLLTVNTSTIPALSVTSSSNTQAAIAIGSAVTSTEIIKLAGAAKQDDFQAARGGTLGTADTSGAMPSSIARLQIGRRQSVGIFNGHIRKIAYWPKRLTNTLLQQLTT
jgi:hypothetical protein